MFPGHLIFFLTPLILNIKPIVYLSVCVSLFSPRKRGNEYVFTGVGLCVCLSVTTITKKIVDLYQILWECS